MTTAETIRELDLSTLRSAIDRAAQLYYTVGQKQSGVTDGEYDTLINELRRVCPDDHRLTRVGVPFSPADLRNKSEHTIPMGSLDNTEGGIEGFAKWYRWLVAQCDGGVPTIHLSLKMDGSSVAAYYEDGKLQRVISRGNGEVGEDLTANAVKWRHLPTSLPKDFVGVVRGEAMLFSEDFDKVNAENRTPADKISNPRNIGNGILGRSDGKQSQYIKFIAFNVVGDDIKSLTSKMEAIRTIGFQPVEFEVISCGTADEVIAAVEKSFGHMQDGRESLPYEIDGLVACADEIELHKMLTRDKNDALRPRYARAIKFITKKNETTVKGVTITVGHTGAIYPTADLEPVRVGGVTVSSALLNNWNIDSDNPTAAHVKIGDTVEVELAGDIIPKICGVIVSPDDAEAIVEPTVCPACGAPTTRTHRGKTGVVTYCSSPESCGAAAVYRIKHYIGTSKKGLGILGIGSSVLEALTDPAVKLVDSPADLYRLTVEEIEDLQIGSNAKGLPIRLGRSRATSIVSEISKAKQVPLAKFLGALGVDLLGRRRVEILAEECGLNTLDDWLNDTKLATIPGDTTRESITAGLKNVRPVIDELLEVGVVVLEIDSPERQELRKDVDELSREFKEDLTEGVPEISGVPKTADPIAGRTFCFTGTRTFLDQVEARGGIIKSGVSKTLDFLVQKDVTSSSNKTRKAESYGVKILGIATLDAVLKGERDLP